MVLVKTKIITGFLGEFIGTQKTIGGVPVAPVVFQGSRRVSRRGGGSSRPSAPTPTFDSSLLRQTFSSSSARASAESSFLAEQARLAEVQRSIARARGVERQRLLDLENQRKQTERIRQQKELQIADKPLSFVTEVKKKKGVEGFFQSIQTRRKILRTKKQRGTINPTEEAELLGLAGASTLAGTFLALRNLKNIPKAVFNEVKEIIKDPKSLKKKTKNIGKGIKTETVNFGKLLKVSPVEALILVGTEVLIFKGSGKVLRATGKLTKAAKRSITPILKQKGTKVVFVGSQTQKGNKIVTKIIFAAGKGAKKSKFKKGGKAIGFTVVKGKKSATVTVGDIGKLKKGKISKKTTFFSAEITGSKAQKLKLIREINLKKARAVRLRKFKTRRFKRIRRFISRRPRGRIKVIKENIQSLKQLSLGGIKASKDIDKLRKAFNKIKVRGVKTQKFATLSNVFTKNDLSLIVGKTITSNKDLIKFIGTIKGTTTLKTGTLSLKQQVVFKKALQQVLGTISASTTRSRKIFPKLSPKAKAVLVKINPSLVKIIPSATTKPTTPILRRPSVKQKVSVKPKQVVKTKVKPKVRQRVRAISRTGQAFIQLTKSIVRTKQKIKQLSRQKTLQRQTPRQLSKTRTLQRQLLRQQQRQKQRQRLKQVFRRPVSIRPGIIIPRARVPGVIIPFTKKVIKKGKKKPSPKFFNVFVKSKKKFIKVNRRPLTKSQARDRGAFVTDHTTANTFRLRATGRTKKLGKLGKGEGGAFARTRKKFRQFRIKKKRKIVLINKFIERKGKPRIDTRGEKRGLNVAKFLKKRGIKVPRRKPIVRRKTTRRKIRRK